MVVGAVSGDVILGGGVPGQLPRASACSLVDLLCFSILDDKLLCQLVRSVALNLVNGGVLLGGVPWCFLGAGILRFAYASLG